VSTIRGRRTTRIGVGVLLALVLAACASRSVESLANTPPATSAPATTTSSTTTTTASPTTTSTTTTPATTTTAAPFVPPAPGTVAVRTPSGVLALWYGTDDVGRYVVSTPCDRHTSVAPSPVVRGVDVLLDPGHGGLDPGAKAVNGMTEAELNLDVALRVRARLVAAGRTVEMTRDDDYFRTIADRGLLASAIAPKAFVSVHHNSGMDAPSNAGIGSEIYHQVADAESRRLGGLVYEALDASLGAFDIAWTRSAHFGVRYRANNEGTDFYGVLRRSVGVPAILIEGAYLSTEREAQMLATEEFRAAEAQAIADGILRWLTSKDTGEGYQNGFVESGSGGDSDLTSCRDPNLDAARG
jgi:N-acetylmuramoyl-L-alanine amidase